MCKRLDFDHLRIVTKKEGQTAKPAVWQRITTVFQVRIRSNQKWYLN
nr:MAG TPA: hypothetical protein [Caudoviricetes sp.]